MGRTSSPELRPKDMSRCSHALCRTLQTGDMERVQKATGARVQTTVNNLDKAVLGTCATFEERQVRGGVVGWSRSLDAGMS